MKTYTIIPMLTDHADGVFAPVDFELANGTVRVMTKGEILHPIVLLIE